MSNSKRKFYKIILGLIIIPLGLSTAFNHHCKNGTCDFSTHNFSAYSPEFNHQRIEKDRKNWLKFIWGKRPKTALGARSLRVCAVAPGLMENLKVWSDRPLFLWHGKVANQQTTLKVREEGSKNNLWEKTVNIAEKKVFYKGQTALKSGKTYEWKLEDATPWIKFQVMSNSDRQKIQADLDKLKQKIAKSQNPSEEIALHKASYFLTSSGNHKRDWSDALQALYEVDSPSKGFIKNRQKFLEDICNE